MMNQAQRREAASSFERDGFVVAPPVLSVEQVERIGTIAQKHGFKLAGFRSFEKALDDAIIERVRKNALGKR